MEANPGHQTGTEESIRRARFRRGPATPQPPAATPSPSQKQMFCKGERSEMPLCSCTSGISIEASPSTSNTQPRWPDSSAVHLNCSLHPSSAASLDQSTVISGGAASTATKTLLEEEGSLYNGRRSGHTEFLKPSTTTAMSMPGADEETIYNGKIGRFLFSCHQLATNLASPAITNEFIFDQNGEYLVSFGKFTSSQSAATWAVKGTSTVHETSLKSDKTSCARLRLPKRSRQGGVSEDSILQFGTSALEHPMQSGIEDDLTTNGRNKAGTSGQLPAPIPPLDSSCRKRRKIETVRVLATGSDNSGVPSDGYKWWKYGQKHIKGSPYPKSYYMCKTQDACLVKREVIKAVDDPSMLDVTYKGEHSHPPLPTLNALSGVAAAPSAVPSTAAAAHIAPSTVPTAPPEEPTTTQFFEFL